ncbi:hypothetical protein EXIGLDRAFT_730603 [Exidia glandulosa HHB12029]|uniref:Uncharacterized protein n=1 Tax=Exidia glandulosa HHB12029 TaxID=1314781 RepID=A0A165C405_EXIGL|nr:hypothetical protein EXIGLDRAFT_730603 [Exidia glandulosa HHB12029]
MPMQAAPPPTVAIPSVKRSSTIASDTDGASTVVGTLPRPKPSVPNAQSIGASLRADTLSPTLDATKSYTPLPSPGASQSQINLTTTNAANQNATSGGGMAAVSDTFSPVSKLAKLQSYLPTGTWITFSALTTWAFTIRPNDPPPHSDDPSQQSNCNSHQRIALCVIIVLGVLVSFGSAFIKSFIVDATGKRILYPQPAGAQVARPVTDSVTGVTFPYRTKNGKYAWPVTGRDGGWVRKGKYIKVMVFREDCDVKTKGPMWERMSASILSITSDIELVPKTDRDHPDFLIAPELPPPSSLDTYFEAAVPVPTPRWKNALQGPNLQYLDFSRHVWLHALVSLLAFATLSLFSNQVTKCIYPAIPDYLPGIAQTTMLAVVSFLAAYVVDDQGVGVGQGLPVPRDADESEVLRAENAGIPASMYSLVEGTLWARRKIAADTNRRDVSSGIGGGGMGVLPARPRPESSIMNEKMAIQ